MPISQMRKLIPREVNQLKVTQPGRVWIRIKLIWFQSQQSLTAYQNEPPSRLVPGETLPMLKDNWLLGSLYLVPSPQVTHVNSS